MKTSIIQCDCGYRTELPFHVSEYQSGEISGFSCRCGRSLGSGKHIEEDYSDGKANHETANSINHLFNIASIFGPVYDGGKQERLTTNQESKNNDNKSNRINC